ncbi:hypothetical protein KI387_035001, partial [Taxus chinensis]
MSVLLSRFLLVYKNTNVELDSYPRDSVSSMECVAAETEIDFVVNANHVKGDAMEILDFPGGDDSHSYSKSQSCRHTIRVIDDILVSQIEQAAKKNNDELVVNGDEDNNTIEKLICKFTRCLVDNVFKVEQPSCPKSPDCEVLYSESFHLEKGVKFKISMEVHHQYSSLLDASNSMGGGAGAGAGATISTLTYGQNDNTAENYQFAHKVEVGKDSAIQLALPPHLRQASYRNPLNLNSGSTSTVDSYPHLQPIELALPPRLQQASYRNPLNLNSRSTSSTDSYPPLPPVLCGNKLAVKPALYNAVKIQKDLALKLWTRSRDMIRTGKTMLKRPRCLQPNLMCEEDPHF